MAQACSRLLSPAHPPSLAFSQVRAYAWLKPVIDGYRPEFYWYELLECVRKLALVGLLIPVGQVRGVGFN